MKELVTIISPVYNGEAYIANCIKSVAAQTYKNFEMIIVNDGSKDNTEKIIKKYQKKYKWLQLISITNHGQGYARNLALKEAKGEYILYLDSDDFINENLLKKSVDCIRKDKSDYVFFDYKLYNPDNDSFRKHPKIDFFEYEILTGKYILSTLRTNGYFIWNKLYRKSFITKNNIKFGEGYFYEDIEFYFDCVIKAKRISIIPDDLYYYVENPESVVRKKVVDNTHAIGRLKSTKAVLDMMKKSNYTNEEMAYTFYYMFDRFLFAKQWKVPKEYKKWYTKEFKKIYTNEELPRVDGKKIYNYFVKHKVFDKGDFTFSFYCFLANKRTRMRKMERRLKGKINNLKRKKEVEDVE